MRQVSADWVIEDEPEKRLEQSKASGMQNFTSKRATSGNYKILKSTSRLSAAVPGIAKKSTKRPSDLEMFCFSFQAQSSGIQTAESPKNFCTFCFQG